MLQIITPPNQTLGDCSNSQYHASTRTLPQWPSNESRRKATQISHCFFCIGNSSQALMNINNVSCTLNSRPRRAHAQGHEHGIAYFAGRGEGSCWNKLHWQLMHRDTNSLSVSTAEETHFSKWLSRGDGFKLHEWNVTVVLKTGTWSNTIAEL